MPEASIYPIEVQIASTPIQEVISQRPDNFALNNTDNVNLTITNPRVGAINNVIVTPSGIGCRDQPAPVFYCLDTRRQLRGYPVCYYSLPGGNS